MVHNTFIAGDSTRVLAVSPPVADRTRPLSERTGAILEPPASTPFDRIAPSAIVGILLVLLYGHIALRLVGDWYTLPDFSHGFLIPPFVAYLLWDQRAVLRNIPVAPSWSGLWALAPGLFVLLVGVFGADLFLSRASFVLLAIGLTWTLCGLKMLRQLRFVFFVFFLAIPLPTLVLNQITFPLQLLASQLASALLPLAGVPVMRAGNVIQLASMQLEVAEACSGIRSLLSLFTLAVVYGYFLESSTWKRVVLALASIPLAVAANVVRIFGTGICVQYWSPDKAQGFFHEFSGWLMFLVSLACLYGVHRILGILPSRDADIA